MSDINLDNELKASLRRSMRARLAGIPQEQQESWSRDIVQWLTSDESWLAHPGTVALFGGIPSEPDLRSLLPWLADRGSAAAFFAVAGEGQMKPHLVRDAGELVSGAFGVLIPEISRCPAVPEEDLAAVLVPGLAFSIRDGARLGRGKGYYDRVLARLRPQARVIGVGFSMQMLNDVPRLAHDRCMDSLVSENGWRTISESG